MHTSGADGPPADAPDTPAARMLDSLPERLSGGRTIRALFAALGDELAMVESGIDVVLRARWPEECDSTALDRLSGLLMVERARGENDRDFRRRLRDTISVVLQGSGDAGTLRRIAASTLGPGVVVHENPARGRRTPGSVPMGGEIAVANRGLDEAPFSISLVLRHVARDLKISVLESGSYARLTGAIREGDHVRIDSSGAAWVNGDRCDGRLVLSGVLALPRGESRLCVSESRGRFDGSRFDEAVIALPRAGIAEVELGWEERSPATVGISLPVSAGRQAGANSLQAEAARAVTQLRVAGVRMLLDLRHEFADAGSGGREPAFSIAGGFSAADGMEMSDLIECGATLAVDEKVAGGGRRDEAAPAGRLDTARYDSEVSRFA